MKNQLRIFQRNSGVFYIEDTATKKQESLRTKERGVAERILAQRREALHNPAAVNLHVARHLILASNPNFAKRTWEDIIDAIIERAAGPTRDRWLTAKKDQAFDHIRTKPLVETEAADFQQVLKFAEKAETVSTQVFLRRIHNFALKNNFLLGPVVSNAWWKPVEFKEKRAITEEEYEKIIAREQNPELRAYYEVIWRTGGAQTDVAELCAENIDWHARDREGNPAPAILFYRRKTRNRKNAKPCRVGIGPQLEAVLKTLPQSGPLFPWLRTLRESDRAAAFSKRLKTLGITGVSLHSFRYSVAELAKELLLPERAAQELLGHNSRAFARHYSRGADLRIPSLEVLKAQRDRENKVVAVEFARAAAPEDRQTAASQ